MPETAASSQGKKWVGQSVLRKEDKRLLRGKGQVIDDIKLGTGILVLPLRNPIMTAKVLATLDQISKGRLVIGAAAGWYAREFDAVGIPFKERGTPVSGRPA